MSKAPPKPEGKMPFQRYHQASISLKSEFKYKKNIFIFLFFKQKEEISCINT